jgi:Concanavalin A-like lectin/glucanases superfamily
VLGTVTLYVGGGAGAVEIDVTGRAAGIVVRRGTTTVQAVASHQVSAEVVLRDDSDDASVGDAGTGDDGAGEDDGARLDAGAPDADVDDAVDGTGEGDGSGDAPKDGTVDSRDGAADAPAPDAPPVDGPGTDTPVPDGPATDAPPPDGMTNPDGGGALQPFLRLKFDETSGTVAGDSSGNKRDGTLSGNATHIAGGHLGGAVHLDGMAATYVALPANLLDTIGSVTIATWVRVGTLTTYSKVFDFGSGSAHTMSLAAQWSNGPVRFSITTSGMPGEQVLQGTAALPMGVWTHVAVVLGPNGGVLYVDGAMVATNAAVTLRPMSLAPTPNVWLGRSQLASTPNLDCDIDDFRIYDRALTAAEVAAVHGATQ